MLSIIVSAFLQIAAAPAGSVDLIHDPLVLRFCRVLVTKAMSERHGEQGAFIVETPGGMRYFVAWPPSDERDVMRWYGRFPEGTIAIVHTHPQWLPEPSKLDAATARRARIPVYVVTAASISKTAGGDTEIVVKDWFARKATTTEAKVD